MLKKEIECCGNIYLIETAPVNNGFVIEVLRNGHPFRRVKVEKKEEAEKIYEEIVQGIEKTVHFQLDTRISFAFSPDMKWKIFEVLHDFFGVTIFYILDSLSKEDLTVEEFFQLISEHLEPEEKSEFFNRIEQIFNELKKEYIHIIDKNMEFLINKEELAYLLLEEFGVIVSTILQDISDGITLEEFISRFPKDKREKIKEVVKSALIPFRKTEQKELSSPGKVSQKEKSISRVLDVCGKFFLLENVKFIHTGEGFEFVSDTISGEELHQLISDYYEVLTYLGEFEYALIKFENFFGIIVKEGERYVFVLLSNNELGTFELDETTIIKELKNLLEHNDVKL